MQRQLSNVSVHSYQDYQPSRRYGPQYEPGGYAAAVQQRTNMTQREDALKFEQGRIKALQEERLHIQKKTFTKWVNSFLQKARMEVDDLFVDLGDGRRLLKLLEIISGERLPRPNTGRMRVHKIENVNKSLSFLHTKVRLESIGAEDIVDGNPRLILGLVWTIILRFQIQEIEIDVDEENESSEKKSAKDALLLWCQRKTSGYHGVHIHNFTDSWRSGLGFNALIHAHRPDLFRWSEVPVTEHVETLNHAFDVAHKHLGIPKLLDAEDVDTTRPDEKSVMTYVASYYHTFARMKNEQKSGRRIANIIGQLMDVDDRKSEYSRLVSALLEWIRLKIEELNGRDLPNSLDGIQRLLLAFKQYRTVEKPPKYKERSEIEALYFDINTMNKSLVGEAWAPLEGQLPQDLERAWQKLEQAEHAREIALRTELLRQQRLEQLNYKFNTKSVLRKGYLKEMIQVLSDPRYGSNLAQVDATVKKHEAISADILARTERFEDLSAMAAELVRENYHGAEAVERTEQQVLQRWKELLQLLEMHRESLGKLAHLMALCREADAVEHTLLEMKAQFQSEEVGRHLVDVERLLQAHALAELQLGALHDSIRRLARHGAQADGPATVKQQLTTQLATVEDAYDSLVAAAKDRKARLEDARNLFQFLEDHDEEEGWVTDKQRICRADVAAKDLRGVLALKQKHTALLQELRAREHISQRHRAKGQSLIDARHPKSAEIERRLTSLHQQWQLLQELAAARMQQLADAEEAHQFYGDANEAESWMKEKRPLVASSDIGVDAPSAGALLARHRPLHEQIMAYAQELKQLCIQAEKLQKAGITTLQLPTEVESAPALEEEEYVNESRLVPTEVWEEEPVERLEHRTVTEQRQVPQVKALYPFTGQGISMAKGEVMFLINKTNPDWWSVRKADRTDGFVPANYVREIEPRVVPVQVRRPEKVRTVQRVKKTVLVKQVVRVKRNKPQARRASKNHVAPKVADVETRINEIQKDYDELISLSAARRAQLEDAIKLYSFFAECDDFDKWIKEKEKMLRTDETEDTVDTAKRKYEKFVTDLSAASKRLEHIDAAAEELVANKHSQAAKATARRQQLREQWDRLLRLKQQKEKSLEGASSVELFSRTCDEALDWMAEKAQQLGGPTAGTGHDLRTVRALQRRHAQLERELEPLREKVNTITLLADSVKSQYPSERANVEGRQKEIHAMWERCQAQAAERRSRLENAVGAQVFASSSAMLQDWIQNVEGQLSQEATAKDVATAESLHKQHQELKDDIKAHDDEFKEVIGLGKQLLANNPGLTDVAEKIKQLEAQQKAVDKGWQTKEAYLKQLVQLQAFNREADQIDASSGAHEACLQDSYCGSSVDEAEALLKRHEELEARLQAQEDRLVAFAKKADAQQKHYASDHIKARKEAVLARRENVKKAAAERRRALQASLAHQQFIAAVEELQAWIQDKTRTANDQSYRDLANLERKLQKHEAFERELQANEKQLRNVESVGQSLQNSDPARAKEVSARLDELRTAWEALVAASRDKGSKLRQASAQRKHRRSIEDAKARLVDLERSLKSEEVGTDLRSCKRLLNQHQALEQELNQYESRAQALSSVGADLVSSGHFDAAAIEKECKALLVATEKMKPRAQARREALNTSLQLHKFAAEVAGELDWLSERSVGTTDSQPADLHAAQTAQKKHAKLKAELAGRRPHTDKILERGRQLIKEKHPESDKIEALCRELEEAYSKVSSEAEARGARLEAALKAQQFLHDALEVDSWLADKAAALSSADVGRDRHRATQLLTRHKAVELELDTYAAIIAEMGHVATSMAGGGHPEGEALVARHALLAESLERLQRLARRRQQALVESVCRHEYLAESAELESWIQEQYTAASSEDYGQDYEHLLILRSKFDELRHRVESGAERFNQCEDLANKLVASDSPYIADIEKRQAALGESWQRLVEQISSRARRLHAAGEIHRYHRDVGELLARAADKRAALAAPPPPRDLPAAQALLRNHDTIENDLVAIDAQMQVLQEEGSRLQQLYPGGNVQQISLRARALGDAWTQLRAAADARRHTLNMHLQLHQFLTQVRDLTSWSRALRASMQAAGAPAVASPNPRDAHPAHSAASAQTARADHDAARADIDARDDSFRAALEMGQELVAAGHPAAAEIEEKCEALLEERRNLHGAWAARQVALDQLIDLHCFLRDAKQLHDITATQEAAMSTEIPPNLSVEEVDNLLKKHEAFEKLLATQDEKLATLQTHGDKLLQQNHVESQAIADELRKITDRRKKLHGLVSSRRALLVRTRARAQFARDAAEARAWLADKLAKLNADHQHGEVTDLEDKIKKLQKHQAFTAELAANSARLQEIQELAKQLAPDPQVDKELEALKEEWRLLEAATEERGRGLEEAQDILEFNQHLDKIEAWIRDKELMVSAGALGRDYEHAAALMRKLEDLDSDMKVDDKHVRAITALADKLLQQGPTQRAAGVASRRDAVLAKWRALSGALQAYKDRLSAALEIHSYNRDVEDTAERIAKKAALFSSAERGRDLGAAQELKRKHLAHVVEAQAVKDKIQALEKEGNHLASKHSDRADEIRGSVDKLRAQWDELQQLADRRSKLLDEAIAEHQFDENLKELEAWVSESVKRMDGQAPESVSDAEALLELHQERKAEIDGRQKAIVSLQKEAEHIPEKKKKVEQLSETLASAWHQRKARLTQAHQLQLLKEQARQTEDWLAAKEAILNNDDLGENLDAVEALIRKHQEFAKLLDSQLGRVDELEKFAQTVLSEQGETEEQRDVQARLNAVFARRDRLKESCTHRGEMLEQSKQLHQFLRNLYHEREWIALKMQIAHDQSYRELSNLQSKIHAHAAFESELAANKRRIDDVANHGEELAENKHYASNEIASYVEELENQWRELQSAAKLRRSRLQEAYQARVYLRGLDDFTAWLDEAESQLLSGDHGKDLASANALLKRHARLEQQVASKADTANQLADNARQLADSGHFMAEEILEKADHAVNRYRQLQEPMQIRRDNLEDAAQLHRWERDAEEEIRWLRERESAVRAEDYGQTLPEAQALLKKHLALEAELIAREPIIKGVTSRATALCRRGHFAAPTLESRARDLNAGLRTMLDAAAARTTRLHERCQLLQLLSEMSEAEAWLRERRSALVSNDFGRDEDSVLALTRRLEALQRELQAFDSTLSKLDKAAGGLAEKSTTEGEQLQKKMEELKTSYEDMKLLSAKRQQRLQQSLKYFKFVQECEEVQEWISEQMTAAASEEYGLDVEHVETLQQAFDNFLAQLHANEGRIEAVCEAGNTLLEENSPEGEKVRQRIDDIKGLWDDLKELALARQEALAGARQVHEFDRSADETAAWVAEKESALLAESAAPRTLHALHSSRQRLRALQDDLRAIRDQHEKLQEEAQRLGAAFPDAKEHVVAKLEDVTEALESLEQRAEQTAGQLELAGQLQHYFGAYQELLAWTNETLARVTAPELASDVAGAERLVARHGDIHGEIEAKKDAFSKLYADGEKLIKEGHFMSGEIEERMSALRQRRAALDAAWDARATIYAQHLDALLFKKEANALDTWIQTRVPLVRDGKYGESVSQVEELINRHKDLEETIEAQKDRFNALKRITLVEQAFKQQQDSEREARVRSAERAEAERAEQYKRREMARIAEERRRDTEPTLPTIDRQISRESERTTTTGAPMGASSEETLSPAPQFERLPKADAHVKRAESMSVVKTPKRTPSFTTRRRTQSFRRHRRGDQTELPPVEIEGYLERKAEWGGGGARAAVRSWRRYYSVLCGQLLCFFRDELDFASAKAAAPPVAILNARCEVATDYTKRAHVFRLHCADGAQYLFGAASQQIRDDWVAKLAFHAQLPPELQLTPYSQGTPQGESPTAELRRRLHENDSTSEDEAGSPAPRPRTQAEILHEHRSSQLHAQRTSESERHIESSVLPSLPPRQVDEEAALRHSGGGGSGWGRTRFSNGRDINTAFIDSQREAEFGAPPLPVTRPPERHERPGQSERGNERSSQSERGNERSNQSEKQSVTALVNNYQRMAQRQDVNRNPSYQPPPSYQTAQNAANNNWNVETTSHFYSASELAYGSGGNSGAMQRPASVAGSGGSPALDQRPASRSSGESELSVTSVTKEKKDKKGVFGGLFSRKKNRPNSHM